MSLVGQSQQGSRRPAANSVPSAFYFVLAWVTDHWPSFPLKQLHSDTAHPPSLADLIPSALFSPSMGQKAAGRPSVAAALHAAALYASSHIERSAKMLLISSHLNLSKYNIIAKHRC